jgi:SpoVK/Ycf46/Vps4 family AAA+-type ATPase
LLARAAAAESGAAFLELSLSSLSSKWFGDSVRAVRGAFSLAEKLAPSVLFVDEVDSLLGRRGAAKEHEAKREIGNEFMLRWEGIRSGGSGAPAVMVLAATNRPFDLDEAALRRFTARVAVPLPDRRAREEILGVLLAGQALAADVELGAVAEAAEGYSGADLRQLCVAAAMRPVRELLEGEEAGGEPPVPEAPSSGVLAAAIAGGELGGPGGLLAQAEALAGTAGGGRAALRPVSAADFEAARLEVRPTVDPDSASVRELEEWGNKYGTLGGKRAATRAPSYFT